MNTRRLQPLMNQTRSSTSRGVVAVEFALSFVFFMPLFLGAIEIARFAYLRNIASEATRIGARTVALCDPNEATVNLAVSRMRAILPQIPESYSGYVTVSRMKSDMSTDCTSTSDCAYVRVALSGVPVPTVIPLFSLNLTLPTVSTTAPRELMVSTNNGFCS